MIYSWARDYFTDEQKAYHNERRKRQLEYDKEWARLICEWAMLRVKIIAAGGMNEKHGESIKQLTKEKLIADCKSGKYFLTKNRSRNMGFTKPQQKKDVKPKAGFIYFNPPKDTTDQDKQGIIEALNYLKDMKVKGTLYLKSDKSLERADLEFTCFFNGPKRTPSSADMDVLYKQEKPAFAGKTGPAPQNRKPWGGKTASQAVRDSSEEIPSFE